MAYTWHISTRFKWHFRWVPMADGDPIVKALQRLVQEMGGSRCVSVEFSHVFTSKMAISTKYQWEFQDPIHGGTIVPYFWPYELWGYSLHHGHWRYEPCCGSLGDNLPNLSHQSISEGKKSEARPAFSHPPPASSWPKTKLTGDDKNKKNMQ